MLFEYVHVVQSTSGRTLLHGKSLICIVYEKRMDAVEMKLDEGRKIQ